MSMELYRYFDEVEFAERFLSGEVSMNSLASY